MTVFPLQLRRLAHSQPLLTAAAVVVRVALGLFLHGLRHPGERAAVVRESGRVVRR